jgi:hypothetical protein
MNSVSNATNARMMPALTTLIRRRPMRRGAIVEGPSTRTESFVAVFALPAAE